MKNESHKVKTIRTKGGAARALQKDVENYLYLSRPLKDDEQLLLVALNELQNVKYCADQWDTLFFSTSLRLKEHFAYVVNNIRDREMQVSALMWRLRKLGDNRFSYRYTTGRVPAESLYYNPEETTTTAQVSNEELRTRYLKKLLGIQTL